MAEARRDTDPYRRAQDEPAFLDAVAAAYRGRWGIWEALWWASHPDQPTPDGRQAPVARLRSLQRRAFAADGDAAGDESVARAIGDLDAEIAAERAAIESALGTAQSHLSGTSPAVARSAAPGRSTVQAAPHDETDVAAARGRPQGRMLVAGWIAALAVGAVLGGTITAGSIPARDPVAEVGDAVLVGRVFDRIQTPKDIPLATMPKVFDPDSFRYLGSAGWTDVDSDGATDSPYYAARGASGTVCLVVVPADGGYLSTCALESAYPEAGLRLTWQGKDLHPDGSDDAEAMVVDITVALLGDATVETRGSGRAVSEP